MSRAKRLFCRTWGAWAPHDAQVALGVRKHRYLRGIVALGARTPCNLRGILALGARTPRNLQGIAALGSGRSVIYEGSRPWER